MEVAKSWSLRAAHGRRQYSDRLRYSGFAKKTFPTSLLHQQPGLLTQGGLDPLIQAFDLQPQRKSESIRPDYDSPQLSGVVSLCPLQPQGSVLG